MDKGPDLDQGTDPRNRDAGRNLGGIADAWSAVVNEPNTIHRKRYAHRTIRKVVRVHLC